MGEESTFSLVLMLCPCLKRMPSSIVKKHTSNTAHRLCVNGNHSRFYRTFSLYAKTNSLPTTSQNLCGKDHELQISGFKKCGFIFQVLTKFHNFLRFISFKKWQLGSIKKKHFNISCFTCKSEILQQKQRCIILLGRISKKHKAFDSKWYTFKHNVYVLLQFKILDFFFLGMHKLQGCVLVS